MKIGSIVKIKNFEPLPEVVGESAEIVDLQMQEYEKYRTHPVWAKMTSGNHKGNIYGFHYDEVDLTTVEDVVITAKEGRAMKIGTMVRIKKCEPMPEVVGDGAEIVDLQMQEYEQYRTYPVWVKMTSGNHKDKIYGFHYDEIEVLPEKAGADLIRQVEEILMRVTAVEDIAEIEQVTRDLVGGRVIRVGDTIKVKKCDSMPEALGENAEVVDLQMQDYEQYRTYPVWAKMTSGNRKGKIYGFYYDEVEVLPKAYGIQTAAGKIVTTPERVKTKVARQLEEILAGVTTAEDIAEVERVIKEAKGKILLEPTLGFWTGKTPCWEMVRCPEAIRNDCPAFSHRDMPCWQIEGTYTKLCDGGRKGDNTDVCRVCRVYKRWGQNEPVEIKLRDKGLNQALKTAGK